MNRPRAATNPTTRGRFETGRAIVVVLAALAMVGCAHHYTDGAADDPYGFFSGLWHGFIWPFAAIVNLVSWFASLIGVSLFASIELVGQPNTGFGYYAGFVIGLLMYLGAGADSR